jgi:hypothetical protein
MSVLPKKVFLTGAPGSKWSAIAQLIEGIPGTTISDRSPERIEGTHAYHQGVYFGPGMEFEAVAETVDLAYTDPSAGCMIAKSHHWAYALNELKEGNCAKEGNWILMVYRPDLISYTAWMTVGGFRKITYPDYSWYKNGQKMLYEIQVQNNNMLKFAFENKLTWSGFTRSWIKEQFGSDVADDANCVIDHNVLVTIYKPT